MKIFQKKYLFQAIFFIFLLFFPIVRYLSFHSSFWDLGFYDWFVFQKAYKWQYLLKVHAHFLGFLYAFLYKILPSPIVLLLCQTLAIVGAIWLVVKIVSSLWIDWLVVSGSLLVVSGEKGITTNYKQPTTNLFPLLFFLYPPVWYNCLFDFHFEHLFVLFCAVFYWLVVRCSLLVDKKVAGLELVVRGEKKKTTNQHPINYKPTNHKLQTTNYKLQTKISVFLICFLCCLVKEVFALSAAMMGMYVIIRRRWWITGSLIVVCSLLYFLFVELYAIPYFSAGKDAASMWHDAFGYLGSDMKEIFFNLLTHPWLVISETFSNWQKIFYLIAIFGPFLFIPLLSPIELLPALPQLLISLLSHNPNHYAIGHQYTAGLIVPVFVAFIIGLPRAVRLVSGLWLMVSSWWLVERKKENNTNNQQPTTNNQPLTTNNQQPTTNSYKGGRDGGKQFSEAGSVENGFRFSGSNIYDYKKISKGGDIWVDQSSEKSGSISCSQYSGRSREGTQESVCSISISGKGKFSRSQNISDYLQKTRITFLCRAKQILKRYRHNLQKIEFFNFLFKNHQPPTTNHQQLTTNHQLLMAVLFSSLLFHILLSPSLISQMFWRNKVWSYGWKAYIPTQRDKMIKEALKKYIPADPNVVVSTQNTLNWSYLAHRKYYFCFPTGVTEPAKIPRWDDVSSLWSKLVSGLLLVVSGEKEIITNHQLQTTNQPTTNHQPLTTDQKTTNYQPIYADYVVLDLKRPWFIKDRGCPCWKEERCCDPEFASEFLKLIKEMRGQYDLVYEKDGFMIFRRSETQGRLVK